MKKPIKPKYPEVNPDIIHICSQEAYQDSHFNIGEFILESKAPIQNIRLKVFHEIEYGYYDHVHCVGSICLEIFSDKDIEKVINYEQQLNNFNIECEKYYKYKGK